jgi:hypothetical protein
MSGRITKADMIYKDEKGEEWITAEAIANLWNKRAAKEFKREARYTRWAARNRVESSGDLPFLDTEHGRLYNKRVAETVKLRPRSKPRPDVLNRRDTAFKKKK